MIENTIHKTGFIQALKVAKVRCESFEFPKFISLEKFRML